MLCVAAAVWAAGLELTGGFYLELGPIRLSSRRPWNAVVISLLSALAVSALSARLGSRSPLHEEWSWWQRLGSPILAPLKRQLRPYQHIISALLPYQHIVAALMIGLITIWLDIHQWLSARPLWLDEETIALNVRDRSLAELGGLLWLGQAAPFGWLVIERLALLTLGAGEIAVRFVPLLFGIATLAAALWIGRRWLGPAGATVLMLLCSVSQWLSHYRFEVKHYTADVFFALLLPALVIWAIEADAPPERSRRTVVWWLAAAVGLWLANGALLVTPACALFLLGARWRRDGRGAALQVVLCGLIWLASFGVLYQLSLRDTLNNPYLAGYWQAELPAAHLGLPGTLRWTLDRIQPLAINPGGTGLWLSLWLLAACGFAYGGRPALGLVFATVPLCAFAFAGLRLVPLYQRLSLWIVPALYVGLALIVDRVARIGRDAIHRRQWTHLMLAALVALAALQLCDDIFGRGKEDMRVARPPDNKHQLDDRAAVRWLMRQRQPGDAVMTTHLGWPAVWWYGDIPIGNRDVAGGLLPDGSAMYEVSHESVETTCGRNELRDALKDRRRVLVYLGFRDVPSGFDDLLLHSLEELGTISAYYEFSQLSRAAVIDLDASGPEAATPRLRTTASATVKLDGCVGVRPALRW